MLLLVSPSDPRATSAASDGHLGITRTESLQELAFPRGLLSTIALAHRKQVIDLVCIDYLKVDLL